MINHHDNYSSSQARRDAEEASDTLYYSLLDTPGVSSNEASDRAYALEAYALEDVNEPPHYPHTVRKGE